MKNLVVLFLCIVTIYGFQPRHPAKHNFSYGNCVKDNNTVPIYTQVVFMDNPHVVPTPSKPPQRHWYDFFSFRRKATTAAPIASVQIINATVVFPPRVSILD